MQGLGKSTNYMTLLYTVLISSLIGFVIILLLLRVEYSTVFLFLVGLPLVFSALISFSTAYSKIGGLLSQLRWWHILWLFAFLSGLVFRIRGSEAVEENPLDLWAFYRISLMGIVAFMLLGRLGIRHASWTSLLSRGLIGLMALYALMCAASTLWSVFPLWTLYKSVEYFVSIALIAAICGSIRTVREFKTLFDWTWILTSLTMGTVWLGVLIWPNEAVSHGVGLISIQIHGEMPAVSSNSVGELGAVLGIVAFSRFLFQTKQKQFYLVIFLVAMVSLVLSQTRSALTGFLIAIPLVLFTARRIGIFSLLALSVLGVVCMTSVGDLFWHFFLRGQSPELFNSLSGRVDWWEYGLERFREQPFIGYGAYVGGRFVALAGMGVDPTASSIHSAWMEILLGTGLIGLFPLLAALVGTWIVLLHPSRHKASNDLSYRLNVEAIGVLTILSVRSIFAVSFIWHPALEWLLVLGYAEFLRRRKKGFVHETDGASQPLPRVLQRRSGVFVR